MILGIGTEGEIFLYASLTGITILCAYNVLMLFRKLIRHSASVTGAEDVIFWVAVSIYIFRKMYDTTYGSIRWYFILGVVSGAALGFGLLCLERKLQVKFKKSLEKYRKRR